MTQSNEISKLKALLHGALYSGNNYGLDPKVLDYIERSRLFLMEQLLSLAPDTVAFDEGESVVVKAFQASPSIAMHWVRLKGPSAWSPTRNSPFPLVEVIASLKGAPSFSPNAKKFRWPKEVESDALRVKQFLQKAFEVAMPLSATCDLTAVSSESLIAQAAVVEFCIEECSMFSPGEKMNWLMKHDGALVVSRNQVRALIEQDLVAPPQVGWVPAIGRPKGTVAGYISKPMLEVWLEDPSLPAPEAALAWLEKHDSPSPQLEMVHVRLLKQAVNQSFTWAQVQTAIERMENGWEYQDPSDTGLMWQTVLAKRPHFVGSLMEVPNAKKVLRLRSRQGLGVWDFLAESFSADASSPIQSWPSLNGVLELGRRVPLELSDRLPPLLFRTSSLPPWWEQWFDATMAASPLAWLGSKDEQGQRAAALWGGLLVGEGVSNAAQREVIAKQLKLLHCAWERHPEHVSSDVPAVLRGVQHYMELARVNLKEDISVLLGDDALPDPTPDSLGWVSSFESQLGKPGARPKPTRLVMEDTIKWLRLLALPAAPARKPGPRF